MLYCSGWSSGLPIIVRSAHPTWMEPRDHPIGLSRSRSRRSRPPPDDWAPHVNESDPMRYIWFTPNAIDPRLRSRRTSVNVSLLPLGRIIWDNRMLPIEHSWHLISPNGQNSEEYLEMRFNARGVAGLRVIEHRLTRIRSHSRVTDCWELVLLNDEPPRTEQQAYMLPMHSGLLSTQT